MDKQEVTQAQKGIKTKKGRKAGAVNFPKNSIQETLKIPKVIWEQNAGQPMTLIDLATKTGHSVMSSSFGELLRSSARYGLTDGSWSQTATKTISLTALGTSMIAPKQDDNVNSILRQVLECPRVFSKFLSSVNGKIIPPEDICKNTLRRVHNVAESDLGVCYKVIMKNINELGISEVNNNNTYLMLEKLGSNSLSLEQPTQEETLTEELTQGEIPTQKPETKEITKQIFVAHGKNKQPLEQLVKILQKYKIPHVIASDEPHKGRPIGVKVSEEMKRCTAGIFIFTGDEETKDVKGNVVMRPSDNVVYELGAGSVLYGNKIMIFREDGVEFASDFTEFGRITFEKDKLDAKGLELMTELAGLDIIKFSVTG